MFVDLVFVVLCADVVLLLLRIFVWVIVVCGCVCLVGAGCLRVTVGLGGACLWHGSCGDASGFGGWFLVGGLLL